jgi:hypothetical protein
MKGSLSMIALSLLLLLLSIEIISSAKDSALPHYPIFHLRPSHGHVNDPNVRRLRNTERRKSQNLTLSFFSPSPSLSLSLSVFPPLCLPASLSRSLSLSLLLGSGLNFVVWLISYLLSFGLHSPF